MAKNTTKIETVPNQRYIYVKRSSEKDRSNYFKISIDNLERAAQDLHGQHFKLYLYFCANADGYTFTCYPVNFCNRYNVSDSTYDRAFKDLIEKGYLTQDEKRKNVFYFNEVSINNNKQESNDTVISISEEDYKKAIAKQVLGQIEGQNESQNEGS